jgi:hypothetical protein
MKSFHSKITQFQAICIKKIEFHRVCFVCKPLEIVEVQNDFESKYFLVRRKQNNLIWWFAKKRKTLPNEYFYDYFKPIK